jgi:hypothetical protein
MIDPYLVIQHQSLKQTEALVVAHSDVQVFIETEPSPPPSSETVPVATSPTVPARRVV